jgi:hypothetical protein
MFTATKETRNAEIRREIMDLRDSRVIIQREIARLEDIQLFEPHNFTPDDSIKLRSLKADVARIKEDEDRLRTLMQ